LAIEKRLFRISSEVSPASETRTTRRQKERGGPFFGQIAVFVVRPAAPVALEIDSAGKSAIGASDDIFS
jgi:hypothetical protein